MLLTIHKKNWHSFYCCLYFVSAIIVFSGCANIVPPEGGKKDETPPILLSLSPADSLLNTKVATVDLHFNKFVEIHDLEKNMQLSPLLSVKPTVTSFGKRVEIKLVDSLLKDNTTYIISLGNAITDNRENTPFGNFTYTFSTGNYFDSLQVHGRVFDAASGKPDSAATIMLFPVEEGDSAIVKKKPEYIGRADGSGFFKVTSLPGKAFHIYAVYDKANDNLFNPEEDKVGFIDSIVTPTSTTDSAQLVFNLYTQPALKKTDTIENTKDSIAKIDSPTTTKPIVGSKQSGKNKLPAYRVSVDTTNKDIRTMEVNKPIIISLAPPIPEINKEKIYLSYDNNGVEVEAVTTITQDSVGLSILPEWQQDKLYTLRLVKGWAKDTAGVDLLPGKYSFRTKRDDDYGILRINVNTLYTGDNYLLQILKDNDTISNKSVIDSMVTLTLLVPGNYSMKIIKDDNKNGKWDTGDLFKKQQPETVIPYMQSIEVKPGWEHEIDFVVPNYDDAPSLRDRGGSLRKEDNDD